MFARKSSLKNQKILKNTIEVRSPRITQESSVKSGFKLIDTGLISVMKSKFINNWLIRQVSRENDRSIPVESLAKNTDDPPDTVIIQR